jgi:branched-chain amino acid transport system substrate-binding protein
MCSNRAPILVAAGLLAAVACSKPAPVRVGLVSGLSGRHSDLGVSSRNGALLAVERINAAGGVGGRPLELVIRDDRNDPRAAGRAVEELVKEGVIAIVGHATSAMADVTLPIVNRERVLMVSPTVSADVFRAKDDWFVMLYPSNAESARALVAHLARRGMARRVAVLQDLSNATFTRSWVEAFEVAAVAAGGALVRTVSFTSGAAPSWGALAEQALEARPDAILVVANAIDTAGLAQQVRKRGSTVPLLGTDWGFTGDVVAQGGAAVEGALFTLKLDVTDGSPRMAAFRREYTERFARPPDFAAFLGAEAVGVLAEALRTARTREEVRAAVVGRLHEGLQGVIRIDRNGDAARTVFVMTIRDGQIVRLD